MLQLTFLGTSAGVPTKARNVTALAIECLNPYLKGAKQQSKKSRPWLLIDCGEGTQQQLLHTKLSLHQLTAICITHVHGDHCYGLPGLLANAAMSGRTEPLTLIAPKAIATFLDSITLTTELHFPYAVNFIAIEELMLKASKATESSKDKGKFDIELGEQHRLKIDITLLSHRVPSHAFGITQYISRRVLDTDKLHAEGIAAGPLWGQLQQGIDVCTATGQTLSAAEYVNTEQQRTRVVIAGDNDAPEKLSEAISHTDLLVHEATYTADVLAAIQAKGLTFDPMHSSAQQVGRFAQQSGLNNLILTHFSARYQSFDNPNSDTANMGHIRLDATSAYQGNLWLAADFDQYLVTGSPVIADAQTEALGKGDVQYLGSALTP